MTNKELKDYIDMKFDYCFARIQELIRYDTELSDRINDAERHILEKNKRYDVLVEELDEIRRELLPEEFI